MTATNDIQALMKSLTNQPPKNNAIVDAFEVVRDMAKYYGLAVYLECPPSRERSLAITKLEESVMWAIKAIALHQDAVSPNDDTDTMSANADKEG